MAKDKQFYIQKISDQRDQIKLLNHLGEQKDDEIEKLKAELAKSKEDHRER